jgi:transposase
MANLQPCLVGVETCAGAHHIGRRLSAFGHNVRLIPGQYVKPFRKGQKNDYRDAEAIAEAVQRPTMRIVPIKSAEQLDLQALHRIRSRLVGHRTAVINQLRSFLLECGGIVPQGPARLAEILPSVLAQRTDVLSPRMIRLIEELADAEYSTNATMNPIRSAPPMARKTPISLDAAISTKRALVVLISDLDRP